LENIGEGLLHAYISSFTWMRFGNEIFALLSGLSAKDVVPGHFEQSFSTVYGEWNINGIKTFLR
jgi:hypothetical protein